MARAVLLTFLCCNYRCYVFLTSATYRKEAYVSFVVCALLIVERIDLFEFYGVCCRMVRLRTGLAP